MQQDIWLDDTQMYNHASTFPNQQAVFCCSALRVWSTGRPAACRLSRSGTDCQSPPHWSKAPGHDFLLKVQLKKMNVHPKKVIVHVFYLKVHQKNVTTHLFYLNLQVKNVKVEVFQVSGEVKRVINDGFLRENSHRVVFWEVLPAGIQDYSIHRVTSSHPVNRSQGFYVPPLGTLHSYEPKRQGYALAFAGSTGFSQLT